MDEIRFFFVQAIYATKQEYILLILLVELIKNVVRDVNNKFNKSVGFGTSKARTLPRKNSSPFNGIIFVEYRSSLSIYIYLLKI